jgi:UDP-N-acetylglucosamine:LPS N-acetylglucosamine transferase
MTRRFLVVSASMGSGHDAVAAELVRRLEARGHRTARTDVLSLLPPGVGPARRGFDRTAVCGVPFLYAGRYAVFLRPGRGPRPGDAPLAVFAERLLLDLVRHWRPDVVIPVFHLAAQLTGRLRAHGTLRAPSAVVITDFAVHRQWLHPGNDLNLCLTPRIAREVRESLRRPTAVSGALVARRFLHATPGATDWRCHPGPPGRNTVLISAGAWGAGSRWADTARVVSAAGLRPMVLCGRNERLRASLSRVPGLRAMGWVEDMPGLLAASGALIDNAAGQTALEALAAGLPVIGHRPIPGHGKEGVLRMAQEGLTEYAHDASDLAHCLNHLTSARTKPSPAAAAGLFAADPVPHVEALAEAADRGGAPA